MSNHQGQNFMVQVKISQNKHGEIKRKWHLSQYHAGTYLEVAVLNSEQQALSTIEMIKSLPETQYYN